MVEKSRTLKFRKKGGKRNNKSKKYLGGAPAANPPPSPQGSTPFSPTAFVEQLMRDGTRAYNAELTGETARAAPYTPSPSFEAKAEEDDDAAAATPDAAASAATPDAAASAAAAAAAAAAATTTTTASAAPSAAAADTAPPEVGVGDGGTDPEAVGAKKSTWRRAAAAAAAARGAVPKPGRRVAEAKQLLKKGTLEVLKSPYTIPAAGVQRVRRGVRGAVKLYNDSDERIAEWRNPDTRLAHDNETFQKKIDEINITEYDDKLKLLAVIYINAARRAEIKSTATIGKISSFKKNLKKSMENAVNLWNNKETIDKLNEIHLSFRKEGAPFKELREAYDIGTASGG